MRVGFLGLGTMGAAMAGNVARAGHTLSAWNRSSARAEALAIAEPSIVIAESPAAAVRDAEVVITMLADPAALLEVGGAALAAMAPGSILVDMSTVDTATLRALAVQGAARTIAVIDAPVSGSRKPAEDGKLLILAGGDEQAIARARPVLEAMGRVVVVGPSGAGSATKLVLNGLGAHLIAGYVSALALASTLGLDLARTVEVIQSGAFASPLFAAKLPKVLARDFTADFRLALLAKDQRLVLGEARAHGLELPTLEAIGQLIDRALAAGFGDLDLVALVRVLEDQAGVTVGGR